MAKRKSKSQQKREVVQKMAKTVKPEIKSRFGGLIKLAPGVEPLDARPYKIEGEDYLEFEQLPGVYFSKKLFV